MEENASEQNRYHNLKNKLIYILCFGSMLSILLGVYYICFFREIRLDLTQNIAVEYTGENGNGTVQISRHDYNYNQRIQPFYDSLSVQLSSNGTLSNGDEVIVTVEYDEQLAENFNIAVTQNTVTLQVEGLALRFASKDDIGEEYQALLTQASEAYLKKDMERILREDFTSITAAASKSEERIQRVFLKAANAQEHDRIVDIYEIRAAGKREGESNAEETIYYMVVFDDVNTDMHFRDGQVYGEKALHTAEDLHAEEDVIRYFKSKYVLSYEVEPL